ncbi:MAG: M24 family metallopeptidase [Victivallaceae bacterium]|nr:M24 family metallopeptidase [Victivallaceae bacterium]
MKKARFIYGNGTTSADLRYGSGFDAPDDFLYFESDEERVTIVSTLEFDRARSAVPEECQVRNLSDFGQVRSPAELIAAVAKTYQIGEIAVPQTFPLLIADELRRRGLSVTPVAGCFYPQREFKTPAEVVKILAAEAIADLAMKTVAEILGAATIDDDLSLRWNGEILTSEILRGEADACMIRRGALPDGTIVAGGIHGACPHCRGEGTLFAGQPIVVDIFPRDLASGYWGDLTRTFVKGKASAIVRAAHDAVTEAKLRAEDRVRAGANAAQLHQYAASILEKHGFHTGIDSDGYACGFFHSLGHGVGLEIHETPRLSSRNNNNLAGGEVVSVEPGLYYHSWGGMRNEDLVLVEKESCRVLTGTPEYFELA